MLYVYYFGQDDKNLRDQIVDKGLAIPFDEDLTLLSKNDKITVNEQEIHSGDTLYDFIEDYASAPCIIVAGIQINQRDAARCLMGELENPCNDSGETYEENIYNADIPYKRMQELIDEFVGVVLTNKLTDMEMAFDKIKEQAKNHAISWQSVGVTN